MKRGGGGAGVGLGLDGVVMPSARRTTACRSVQRCPSGCLRPRGPPMGRGNGEEGGGGLACGATARLLSPGVGDYSNLLGPPLPSSKLLAPPVPIHHCQVPRPSYSELRAAGGGGAPLGDRWVLHENSVGAGLRGTLRGVRPLFGGRAPWRCGRWPLCAAPVHSSGHRRWGGQGHEGPAVRRCPATVRH